MSEADRAPDDPLVHLRGLRDTVHRTRQARDEAQAQWNNAHEALMLTLADLQGQLNACKGDVIVAESDLRAAALAEYDRTLDKKIIPGVGIREITKYEYDSQTALDWAVEHRMKGLLQLNERSFRSLATAALSDVPFVTIRREPQVTIAADLGAAIAAERALEMEEGA